MENRLATRVADAMHHWHGMVAEAVNGADNLESAAEAAIRAIDGHLAYGSETSGLGNALDDLRRAQGETAILDTLAWWDKAYQAWYLLWPSDGQGHGGQLELETDKLPSDALTAAVDELIFTGSSDLALALAERWAAGELTPDEQTLYGAEEA